MTPTSDDRFEGPLGRRLVEDLILVDGCGQPIGHGEKMAVHRGEGMLHLAFSIFIFNARGRMLLQRRAVGKYHFGGLWSNACCGHPLKGETLEDEAHRRLRQELGFDTQLRELFSFVYTATDVASGLTEREYDHVFCGEFDGDPRPCAEEIDELKWVDVTTVQREVAEHPERYTPWFAKALGKVARLR